MAKEREEWRRGGYSKPHSAFRLYNILAAASGFAATSVGTSRVDYRPRELLLPPPAVLPAYPGGGALPLFNIASASLLFPFLNSM